MKIITILASFLLVFCFACSDSPKRGDPVLKEGYDPAPVETTTSSTTTPPPTAESAQNTEGVWHYTCPNGCAGGAGAAGPCSVCGATLAHNSAYHSSNVTNVETTPGGATSISTNGDGAPAVTTTPTPSPEPAQNASGVWHYTCPSGCAGGGGTAGPCSVCGATLAHNSAYHN